MNPGNSFSRQTNFCRSRVFKTRSAFFRDFGKSTVVTLIRGVKYASLDFGFLFRSVSQTGCLSVVTARCKICRIFHNRTFSTPTKGLVCIMKTSFVLWCCHFCQIRTDWKLFRLFIIDYWPLHVTRYQSPSTVIFANSIHYRTYFRPLTAWWIYMKRPWI